MNYQRLYEYRFRDVDQDTREAVWGVIAETVYERMGRPAKVLDPAAGFGEFLGSIPAVERWSIDREEYPKALGCSGVRAILGDALSVPLPESHFDGVFVSNFLEHLLSQEQVAFFLRRMYTCMTPGGRIAVIGPNFKFCAAEYFDCADHTLALSHVSVGEHLFAAGFEVEDVIPRFLPYSFRGRLPASPLLTRLYLRCSWCWPILGKQFFVMARRG